MADCGGPSKNSGGGVEPAITLMLKKVEELGGVKNGSKACYIPNLYAFIPYV